MELIVFDSRVMIRAPGIPDQRKSFDDVPGCLDWVGEKMLATRAMAEITISDVALLLQPAQRAAFRELFDVPMRGAAFKMSQFNGPLYETVLAFWWTSLAPEWRSRVREKIRALGILPGDAR